MVVARYDVTVDVVCRVARFVAASLSMRSSFESSTTIGSGPGAELCALVRQRCQVVSGVSGLNWSDVPLAACGASGMATGSATGAWPWSHKNERTATVTSSHSLSSSVAALASLIS